MKFNVRTKLSLFIILMLITSLTFCSNLLSYDRGAIVKNNGYIDQHWSNYNGNYTDYSSQGGDCANFGSQCLIAGGIRFVKGTPDTQFPGYWLEEGSNLRKIDVHNSNIWAQGLRVSLKNTRHGAVEYSSLHDSIKPGDIIFWIENGSAYHTLVVRQRVGNEVWVAAHTNDRPGNRTDNTPPPDGPDPSKDDRISVAFDGYPLVYLHLPDAPLVKELTLKLDGTEKYKAHQDPDKFSQNPVVDKSEAISAGSLEIKIVFDTSMKASFPPVVKFGQNAPYDTYAFSNGSWSQTNYPNDTWTATATITSQMPSADYHISVTAQGEDGSQLDKDENLASYEPGPDTLHHKNIDHISFPTVLIS